MDSQASKTLSERTLRIGNGPHMSASVHRSSWSRSWVDENSMRHASSSGSVPSCEFREDGRHSGQMAFRQTTGRSPAPESMIFHPGTDQYRGTYRKSVFFGHLP